MRTVRNSLYVAYVASLVFLLESTPTQALRGFGHSRELKDPGSDHWGTNRKPRSKHKRNEKPNIVFILADDQDSELGSMSFMPKTLRLLQDGGATFTNAFVTTPMCCPSRSSILTGMYVHNHNVYTNNDNCTSEQWKQNYETKNFGTYLTNEGYRTGYFGKYLNEYKGTYIPPGWTEWLGLIGNSRFYNYRVNFNGETIKHGNDYAKDYFTDLIANDSITFLKQSKQYFPNRPVAMVLSMPAPHGPEDSAPQYQHLFANITTHRTPSWNYAPNPDKQWLLQYTGKMEPIHIHFTDVLHQKRLQTLQSIDAAVEKVYREIESLGELDNTYFIYTSDHGYHLGQYGLLKGKAMPYEMDIKVPFYMKGPRIPNGIRISNMVLNIDIAPTLLDIAGVPVPDNMDGRSILKLFEGAQNGKSISGGFLKKKRAWRDTFLVERGKITDQKLQVREELEAMKNNLVVTKQQRITEECQKAEYQPPCSDNQQWECRYDAKQKLRMYKCRHQRRHNDATSGESKCRCPRKNMDKNEKQRQMQFLKNHVNQPDMLHPKFLRRGQKAGSSELIGSVADGRLVNFKGKSHRVYRRARALRAKRQRLSKRYRRAVAHHGLANPGNVGQSCRVLADGQVSCLPEMYRNPDYWKEQKRKIDKMIQELKDGLAKLKGVRRNLRKQKPVKLLESGLVIQDVSDSSRTESGDTELETYPPNIANGKRDNTTSPGSHSPVTHKPGKSHPPSGKHVGDITDLVTERDTDDWVECDCEQDDEIQTVSPRRQEVMRQRHNEREARRERRRLQKQRKRERRKERKKNKEHNTKKKKVPTATLR